MKLNFSATEARIIGALIEKEITTPELYPMTLNALTNACNQKSNRFPVMSLTESEVQAGLDSLKARHLILVLTGQRALKYKHRVCNTEFSNLQLSAKGIAVVCLLLLRGAQTPGELRTRSQRLADFTEVSEVELLLNELTEQSIVEKLPKEPGKRESRYRHLLGDQSEETENSDPIQDAPSAPSQNQEQDLMLFIEDLQAENQQLAERITRIETVLKLSND